MIKKMIRTIKMNRSLVSYLLLAVIPLITITIIVIRMTTNILTENSTDLTLYQSGRVAEILNDETDSILNIYYNALTNPELRSLCSKFNAQDDIAYTTILLSRHMQTYLSFNPHISLCMFIGKDNRQSAIAQKYSSNPFSDVDLSDEKYLQSLFDALERNRGAAFFTHDFVQKKYSAAPVFYIGMPVTNNSRKNTYGILIFGIQKSYFQSASFISDYDNQQDYPQILELTHFVLADEDGQLVYAKDSSMNGESLSAYEKKHGLSEEKHILSQYTISHTNWRLISYCPRNIAFKSVTQGKRLIYLLVVLFTIFLAYFSFVITSHQNKRIKLIANGIQKYSGNEKDYNIPLFSNEYLNIIIAQFNQMANRVSNLTENLIQEKKRSQKEMDIRRRVELQSLEAQINPHFIYNTLDTINWMALDKNEVEISDMIAALGSLLRYSVTNIDTPVLVRAEINWLQKYLFLQQRRFRSLFTYEIITDSNVEDMIIYKMLLQPLIENSILHGFEDITEGGRLIIKIQSEKDSLIITISDNGCGIPEDQMQELQKLMSNSAPSYSDNIGFFNVLGRLRAYYHENYQFYIEVQHGTTIHMVIPNQPFDTAF